MLDTMVHFVQNPADILTLESNARKGVIAQRIFATIKWDALTSQVRLKEKKLKMK